MKIPLLHGLFSGKPLLYLKHRSPGRLRLAGQPFYQAQPAVLAATKRLPGIERVEQNPVTGTLLICYQPELKLEDDVVARILLELPDFQPTQGPPLALRYIRSGFDQLNMTVYRSSRGWVDARLLIPFLLGAYGLKRLVLERQFRMPAALTMMWWSYATLWNLSRGQDHVAD